MHSSANFCQLLEVMNVVKWKIWLTVDELARHYHDVITGSGNRASTVRYAAVVSNGADTLNKGNVYNTVGTQPAGGNTPHNNMQPYLAVYIFKRSS